MKNMRGFIDPISLGFVISLIGTSTVLVTNDTAPEDIVLNPISQITTQQVVGIEKDEELDF